MYKHVPFTNPCDAGQTAMQNGQVGGGSGYGLWKKIHMTPKAHQSLINSASRCAIHSPSPDDRPKLPLSQPDFGLPQRSPDGAEDIFLQLHTPHANTLNAGRYADTYAAAYGLEEYLGPGAADVDMSSFCVDTNISLSPDPMPPHPPPNAAPILVPPPLQPFTAEEQAQSDRAIQAFFTSNGFSEPGLSVEPGAAVEPQASSSVTVDYDAPADDENLSDLALDSNTLQLPNEEESLSSPSGSSKHSQNVGQISGEIWERLRQGFLQIDAVFDQIALETGRTRDNIISLWQNTHSFKRALMSTWNMYQKYFKDNRRQERMRTGDPTANCK